jgi:hypothetical protein
MNSNPVLHVPKYQKKTRNKTAGLACTIILKHPTNNISLGAFAASKLDVIFSGYQPR